jgi:hypothetical protein
VVGPAAGGGAKPPEGDGGGAKPPEDGGGAKPPEGDGGGAKPPEDGGGGDGLGAGGGGGAALGPTGGGGTGAAPGGIVVRGPGRRRGRVGMAGPQGGRGARARRAGLGLLGGLSPGHEGPVRAQPRGQGVRAGVEPEDEVLEGLGTRARRSGGGRGGRGDHGGAIPPRHLGSLEAELGGSDADAVAVLEFVLPDPLGVDEGAVDAAEVLEDPALAPTGDAGVVATGGGVGEHHIPLLGAPHAQAAVADGVLGPRPGAVDQHEPRGARHPGGPGVGARAGGVGVLLLCAGGQGEDQDEGIDEDLVAVLDLTLAEGLAREVGAVAAADILDGHARGGDVQAGVAAGDGDVREHQTVVLRPTDVDAAHGQRDGHVGMTFPSNGELDALCAHGTQPPG